MSDLRSNPSFVRLFLGRLVTNAGDSMYAVAAMWLVYELTGSPFYTGLASFLVRIPTGLQFLIGPLVDQWSLRRLLVGTQLVQGVCVLVIPIAAATGHLSVWIVLVLMPALTFLNQFVYPAQQTTLPRILDDDELVKANSLFSFAYQGLNMVFNAASGIFIAVVGAVTIYLVNSATFFVAAVLFFGLAIPSASTAESEDGEPEDDQTEGYVTRLREGIDYVRKSALRSLLLGSIVVNFAYGVMIAVLPVFAGSRGGAEVYGLLTAAMAAGNLVGAATATLVEDHPFGWITIVGYLLSAVCWTAALAVSWLPATVVLFFAAFVPIGTANVVLHSMLQSMVDNSLLGRVSAVNSSFSTATLPIGSLVGGIIASTVGTTTVMAGLAGASVFISVYFLARPELRSLPSVASADETVLDPERTG